MKWLRELEKLPGFIICSHNLDNICYVEDILLTDSERKLKELLEKGSWGKQKERTNYKKIECMAISKKDSRHCDLYIGGIPKSSKCINLTISVVL